MLNSPTIITDMTNQIKINENESKFLVNVLLDWEKFQTNISDKEKRMWEKLLTVIDPYLQSN